MGIWSNIKWGLTVQSFSLDRFTGFKGHQNDKRMWSGGHVDWPSEELVHISMVENFWHIWETTTSRIQKKIQDITIYIYILHKRARNAKQRLDPKIPSNSNETSCPYIFETHPKFIFISVILEKWQKLAAMGIIPSTNGGPHICQTRVGRWHVESCTTHLGSHVCHLSAGASLVSNIGYAEKDTNITLEGLLGNAGSRSGYG